jgi:hypothetical protein
VHECLGWALVEADGQLQLFFGCIDFVFEAIDGLFKRLHLFFGNTVGVRMSNIGTEVAMCG